MKEITLNNGNTIPALGLGTWKSTPEELYNAIKHAITVGYRHIDCAWIYGNEGPIGNAIADCISEGIVTREELFITGKLWNHVHHPDDVEAACQESLDALQVDYLDLYLIHWPVVHKKGEVRPVDASCLVPIETCPYIDTYRAMEELQNKGLVRAIGASNMSVRNLEKLLGECSIVPAMIQFEVHPFLAQDELIAYCKSKGMAVTAYSPLGSMDRPAAFKSENEPILIKHETILNIAKKHNTSAGVILIAWSLNRGLSVIPKSSNFGRLEENLTAQDIILDNEDMAAIKELNRDFRFVTGKAFYVDGSPYTKEYLWD